MTLPLLGNPGYNIYDYVNKSRNVGGRRKEEKIKKYNILVKHKLYHILILFFSN